MSRLTTTETTEEARARINRQLIAQGGVPASTTVSEVEQCIAAVDRAMDAVKNAVARCKALNGIN